MTLAAAFSKLILICSVILSLSGPEMRSARAATYQPSLTAWLNRGDGIDIEGSGWNLGDTITLTVHDPYHPSQPDLTDSVIATPAPWDPTVGRATFSLPAGSEIQPGFTITLSDGVTTKTLVVPGLEVHGLDMNADTVSGWATPGSMVTVQIYGSTAKRTVTASPFWSVDFSAAGSGSEETTLYDIRPGTGGNATIRDADGDGLAVEWQLYDPSFVVFLPPWGNPAEGVTFDVHGYHWPPNTTVVLTIDKLETPITPDFTEEATMQVPDWGGDPQLVFDTSSLEVHPGDTFQLQTMDGAYFLEHTLTSLRVTDIDLVANQVKGTAAPGSVVDVTVRDLNIYRSITTGTNGRWSADFSMPGDQPDEQDTITLAPRMNLFIGQNNPGNPSAANLYGMTILNKFIEARPNSNFVRAVNWPLALSLTLLVNDPTTPQPVDYSETKVTTNDPACDVPECTIAFFVTEGYDLKAGDIISVIANNQVKIYIVSFLFVTGYDFPGDRIFGEGQAGHSLRVCMETESSEICRYVTVGSSGNWSVNFHSAGSNPGEEETFDIQGGSMARTYDTEEDGDLTSIGWIAAYDIFLPVIQKP